MLKFSILAETETFIWIKNFKIAYEQTETRKINEKRGIFSLDLQFNETQRQKRENFVNNINCVE